MYSAAPIHLYEPPAVDERYLNRIMKVHNRKGLSKCISHRMTVGAEQTSEVFTCRFDPHDKYLASGYGDGAVRIFNTSTGKCAFTLCAHVDNHGRSDEFPVTGLRWRNTGGDFKTNNVLVASYAHGLIKHWHATSGRCLHQIDTNEEGQENHIYTIDYNTDGNILAAAGKDKYIRLYDEQTKSLMCKFKDLGKYPGHSNRIFSVKFNPIDANQIVSGGWDNTIQIYDVRQKGPVKSLYGPHICGESIDFRTDGYTLLTGSYRQEEVLELWDLRKFQKFRDIDWNGPTSTEPLEHSLVESIIYEDDN